VLAVLIFTDELDADDVPGCLSPGPGATSTILR